MRPEFESWVRAHVEPTAPLELEHDRPWATVYRVPVAGDVVWFKHCKPMQAFEPRLTAELYARWPDRVAEVIAHDEERSWLLLADAGTPVGAFGNAPEAWLAALPQYAELQRGEVAYADEHLEHGVPDMRLEALPTLYDELVSRDLPLDDDELARLRRFAPRFAELCGELRGPVTIQHDDLHIANVYAKGDRMLVLDWGDSSVAHPYFSLYETFRFLEGVNQLPPDDPWFARLRDAYLEPWDGDVETFDRALRLGTIARAIAWLRQRDHLPDDFLPEFDQWWPVILRRAVAQTSE